MAFEPHWLHQLLEKETSSKCWRAQYWIEMAWLLYNSLSCVFGLNKQCYDVEWNHVGS